jgi:hypothetical protein
VLAGSWGCQRFVELRRERAMLRIQHTESQRISPPPPAQPGESAEADEQATLAGSNGNPSIHERKICWGITAFRR